MKIRTKIILVVLPLIILSLGVVGSLSINYASTGITRIAVEFLNSKSLELKKYAEGQWSTLLKTSMTQEYIDITRTMIEEYAFSLTWSPTVLILAFDNVADIPMQTGDIEVSSQEKEHLINLIKEKNTELINIKLGGVDRVAKGFYFDPFDWYILISEENNTFYKDVNEITKWTMIILVASVIVSIILLYSFARYLTNPLIKVVKSMKDIIIYNDLTNRVAVEFHDETGQLAHTFNIMIGELEKASNQVKNYAFKAVLAQKKEKNIRNIFQKYVPQEIIDGIFNNPESMLVGDSRVVSILFSDIRGFTTISESMMPDDLVSNLNRYFSYMVDVIMNRKGIIDKYIGDAIMAFFGAPVKHEDDAFQSVLAGIEMIKALEVFNTKQKELQKPPFRIGIGINYGVVTVGNIGTERKMDYTVIGDTVNLASRCEGLTKEYKQDFIITESVYYKVKDELPTRLLDSVAVKGKSQGVKIYTTKKKLNNKEKKAWELHNTGMEHYYKREFKKAVGCFNKVAEYLPQDYASELLIQRCTEYINTPPSKDWDGVKIMKTK